MKTNSKGLPRWREVEGGFVLLLLALQLLLVPLSWVLSALYPQLQLHSLLSGEGLRWALRNLLASHIVPLLPVLVSLSATIGLVRGSKLADSRPVGGGWKGLGILLLMLLLLAWGIFEGGFLLTPSGHIRLGTFIGGAVVILSAVLSVCALVAGYLTGAYTSTLQAVQAAVGSVAKAAPLFLLYLLAAQLYAMIQFVF